MQVTYPLLCCRLCELLMSEFWDGGKKKTSLFRCIFWLLSISYVKVGHFSVHSGSGTCNLKSDCLAQIETIGKHANVSCCQIQMLHVLSKMIYFSWKLRHASYWRASYTVCTYSYMYALHLIRLLCVCVCVYAGRWPQRVLWWPLSDLPGGFVCIVCILSVCPRFCPWILKYALVLA